MKKRIIFVVTLMLLCLLAACGKETAHTHQFGDWKTITEANCVTEGVQERTCSCGETEKKTVPALGHTVAVDAAVAATCTETGLTEGKQCSVCGTVLNAQNVVPALGHTEVPDAAVAAT